MTADTATATTTTPSSKTMKNPLLVLCYIIIPTLWVASQIVLIPYVIHLLVLVTAILYVACHWSLVLLQDETTTEDGTVVSSERETLKTEDAMQFPIMGSLSLFSLYLAFKFLEKDLVNLIIGGYFGIVGCLALTFTMAPALEALAGNNDNKLLSKKFVYRKAIAHKLPAMLAGDSPWEIDINVTALQFLAFVASTGFLYLYFQTKAWPLNNVLGICFCLQGIERFSLGTYKIGAILLVGLFFYDIFWVFGTDVMVTVAKNLDGPIKILFPRDSLVPNPDTGKLDLSLLGLGDIVIPGFFLALLLRFDAHKSGMFGTPNISVHESFAKPYFSSCLVAYVLGLATTLFVMIQFKAAQPALLYLVPACLGSSLLCAVMRGELKELFEYSEEEEEEEEEKKEN